MSQNVPANFFDRLLQKLGLQQQGQPLAPAPAAPGPIETARLADNIQDPQAINELAGALRASAQRRRDAGELPLPDAEWMRQSGPFKSVEQFFDSAFVNFKELLRHTHITPRSRVLDYGCGLGRLGIPLSVYLDPQAGAYCGVDTDADCIARNQAAFGRHDHFRFEHINIFSTMYNRQGEAFETLMERDFGGPYDLTFLFSVFTHILPEHCDLLLDLLLRQLAPRGEILSSWFLLNEATEQAIAEGVAHRDFATTHGAARIDNPEVPEGAVAYYEQDVLERFERAGYKDVTVYFGNWRGSKTANIWQDVIVARAPR